jgi:hypothetical protein
VFSYKTAELSTSDFVMTYNTAAVPPPPVGDGGEGAGDDTVIVRQVGKGGHAKLVDGITTPCIASKGAIDPSILPPMHRRERLPAS